MRNILDFSRLYRRTKTGAGLTGSLVRIRLEPVEVKRLRFLTHVTVENLTSDFDKCRLGINSGGRDHYLDELTTISADELLVSVSDLILGEGDYFFAELTGTVTGDKLVMTAIGWELDL